MQNKTLRGMARDTKSGDDKQAEAAQSGDAPRLRTHGHVIDCDGTNAIIAAEADRDCEHKENYWAVGQLVSIRQGANRVVGQSYKVETVDETLTGSGAYIIRVHVELVGEIQEQPDGSKVFSTGITEYPRIGSETHRIRSSDLEAIYKNTARAAVSVGKLTQDGAIPAKVDLDRLLSRHFAILGSTGVGKSSAVSLLLRKIIAHRKDLRVLILDPHDEFTAAFANEAVIKDADSLQLPFWMFRFSEFCDVVFRGQTGLDQEVELLRDLIAEAKERYEKRNEARSPLARRGEARNGYTADSPAPYRMAELLKLIEERLGQLDSKRDKPALNSLKARVVSISRDPRFGFMFSQSAAGGDRMASIIAELFRVPQNDKPICIVEMSRLPSEVVNAVVSVLCRLAFDLAISSQGAIQTLVMCEEAHRYVPADGNAAFWPTRQSIARIAKEGRKYGVYLGVITQRPSELDATIMSQCNTVFAMRLANQEDQRIIARALTVGAQSSIGFLASIANREAIAFGEALHTPMRMTFDTVPKEQLPGGRIRDVQEKIRQGMSVDLGSVVRRMRGFNNIRNEDDEAESIAALGEPQDSEARDPMLAFAPSGHDAPEHMPILDDSRSFLDAARRASTEARPSMRPGPAEPPARRPQTDPGARNLISSFRSRNG